MNFPVSKSPIGPRRTSGSCKWFEVRMADGSVRCFGSVAAAQSYPSIEDLHAAIKIAAASLAA